MCPRLPFLFLSAFLPLSQASSKTWEQKLPDAVTSFGACASDGFLYVYGGHTGEAHVYSKETHSHSFARIHIQKPSKWEKLPFRTPLQGFGMAASGGKVYIAGGSQATNKHGTPSNLHSLAEVSAFDTETLEWLELSPLPEPRSSHELVAHKGMLYVIGGWNMEGGQGVEWYHHGLVADLTQNPLEWKKLPETKWAARAISAAIANGHLYVIGGLDGKGLSNAVRKLNLNTHKWSDCPPYPSSDHMKAFGSAACNLEGRLLASSFSFQPKMMAKGGKSWEPAGKKLETRRFFHQIVQAGKNKVLFLGGANYDGHLDSIETFTVDSNADPPPGTTWTGFRGQGNSHSQATGLPVEWSDEKNIRWRSALPGYGQSTPVIWDGKVFSTSTEGDWSDQLLVHCHNLANGKVLWKKEYPTPNKVRRSKMVSQAAPSPVVDNGGVYLFWESGLLLSLDHDGKELWKRNLTEDYGAFKGNHGLGTSLFQTEDKLGLLIDHSGPSYLLKIDKMTGKTDWKSERAERVSWSTPTFDSGHVYISSNGIMEAYNFMNGKRLWEKDGIEGNTVASPTLTGALAIIGSSARNHCIAMKRNGKGVAWIAEGATSSFASPLAANKHLYYVNRAGVATCHRLEDGKMLWHKRLPGSCWASPFLAGDNLYFFIKEGAAVVMKADGSGEILAENTLRIQGRIYGVAPVNGAMVVRTGTELICISEK